MKAIQLQAFGDPSNVVKLVDVPDIGAPGPDEIVIAVEASPINIDFGAARPIARCVFPHDRCLSRILTGSARRRLDFCARSRRWPAALTKAGRRPRRKAT